MPGFCCLGWEGSVTARVGRAGKLTPAAPPPTLEEGARLLWVVLPCPDGTQRACQLALAPSQHLSWCGTMRGACCGSSLLAAWTRQATRWHQSPSHGWTRLERSCGGPCSSPAPAPPRAELPAESWPACCYPPRVWTRREGIFLHAGHRRLARGCHIEAADGGIRRRGGPRPSPAPAHTGWRLALRRRFHSRRCLRRAGTRSAPSANLQIRLWRRGGHFRDVCPKDYVP